MYDLFLDALLQHADDQPIDQEVVVDGGGFSSSPIVTSTPNAKTGW